MHILIVKLGSTYPWISDRTGDFEDWIAGGMDAPGRRIEIVSPASGEALPPPGDISGVVLTGSHYMVTSGEEWSEETAKWIREVVRVEKPLLGICYGHQLLALATGGVVGYNSRGREFGTALVYLREECAADPLFGGLASPMPAHVCHAQSVLALPPGAVLLGSNDHDPHHAFRIGKNTWGVQFHPEFPAEAARAYVERNAEDLRAEGKDPEQILRNVQETPESASILRRFGDLVDGAA